MSVAQHKISFCLFSQHSGNYHCSLQRDEAVGQRYARRLRQRLLSDLLSPKIIPLSLNRPTGQAGVEVCIHLPFPFLAIALKSQRQVSGIQTRVLGKKREFSHSYILPQCLLCIMTIGPIV